MEKDRKIRTYCPTVYHSGYPGSDYCYILIPNRYLGKKIKVAITIEENKKEAQR